MPRRSRTSRIRRPDAVLVTRAFLLLIAAALSGCGQQAPAPEKEKKRSPSAHLVQVRPVVFEPVSSAYERSGSLRVRRIARIYNQEEGRILELPWYEGDRVKQGDLLMRLDDALLRAERDKARANRRQADLDLKRMKNLVQRNAASKDERERARTALDVADAELRMLKTRLGYMRLQAPFDGVVSERLVEPGDVIGEHTHVLTLVDPASLVVEVQVSELLLPQLGKGDPAQVRIDALGGQVHQGRVQRIHPVLDRNTRQGVVEVLLEPIPEGARAGQFARVTLQTAQRPRLMIPFVALQRDRDGEFVFRVGDDGKVLRTAVRSGLRVVDRVEILDGLEKGWPVVTRGFLGLTPGKPVKIVDSR